MARNLQVYPKAWIVGSEWTLRVTVTDGTITSRFLHVVPAGVTATTQLVTLKLVVGLTVGDTDTDQDVDDSLFVDDIRPGPQVGTVWGNWRATAETIINSLPVGYTIDDYTAGWTPALTGGVRTDARRAWGNQGRGWTVTSVHQHEAVGNLGE